MLSLTALQALAYRAPLIGEKGRKRFI